MSTRPHTTTTKTAPISRYATARDPAMTLVEELFGPDGHLPAATLYLLRYQSRGTPRLDLEEARWHIEQAIQCLDALQLLASPAVDLATRMAAACDLPQDVVSAIEHIVAAATAINADEALEQLQCAGIAIDDAITHLDLLPAPMSQP
jgi:hypothetical protein